jgi:hypothetical protein
MYARWWNKSWRTFKRRLCAGLTLVSYLVSIFGFPLPAAAAPKSGERFPCENHPCGCQTAEQCWRNCCCTTHEERWAWARANNVEPPSYAEKPKSNNWRTESRRQKAQGQSKPDASPCCCQHQGKKKSCCQTNAFEDDKDGQNEEGQETGEKPASKAGTSWVLGIAALRCGGQGAFWTATAVALPPEPPMAWSPIMSPLGWLACADSFPHVLAQNPPDPPPRLFAL